MVEQQKDILAALAMLERCIEVANINRLHGTERLLQLAKSSMEQSHTGISREEVDVLLSLMARQRLGTNRKVSKSRSGRATI